MKVADFDMQALIVRLRARALEKPWVECNPDVDIAWAENIGAPLNAMDFAFEIVFVICNSGMRFTVARGIYDKVHTALLEGRSARTVFKHPGKSKAIDKIWRNRLKLFSTYTNTPDALKLRFIIGLPWIGKITQYHVAKNFGLQFAKPDVHLDRLANTFETTAQQLCEDLSKTCGLKVATVDTLLWRAAAVGVLDTRTGRIRDAA